MAHFYKILAVVLACSMFYFDLGHDVNFVWYGLLFTIIYLLFGINPTKSIIAIMRAKSLFNVGERSDRCSEKE